MFLVTGMLHTHDEDEMPQLVSQIEQRVGKCLSLEQKVNIAYDYLTYMKLTGPLIYVLEEALSIMKDAKKEFQKNGIDKEKASESLMSIDRLLCIAVESQENTIYKSNLIDKMQEAIESEGEEELRSIYRVAKRDAERRARLSFIKIAKKNGCTGIISVDGALNVKFAINQNMTAYVAATTKICLGGSDHNVALNIMAVGYKEEKKVEAPKSVSID